MVTIVLALMHGYMTLLHVSQQTSGVVLHMITYWGLRQPAPPPSPHQIQLLFRSLTEERALLRSVGMAIINMDSETQVPEKSKLFTVAKMVTLRIQSYAVQWPGSRAGNTDCFCIS